MNPQDQKIQELETKNQDIQKKLDDLVNQVEEIKRNKEFQLSFPLDEQSKKIMNDVIKDDVFDLSWENIFRYTTTFESVSRYIISGTTLSGDVTSAGMVVSTASGADYVRLDSSNTTQFNTSYKTRFQCSARVSATTDIDARIYTLLGTGSVGFQFLNGTLYGFTDDGTTTNSVSLGSYSANTDYKLEFLYQPGFICTFYVNDVEKNSSTSNLLPLNNSGLYIYTQFIEVSGATPRTITCRYFDLMQSKK